MSLYRYLSLSLSLSFLTFVSLSQMAAIAAASTRVLRKRKPSVVMEPDAPGVRRRPNPNLWVNLTVALLAHHIAPFLEYEITFKESVLTCTSPILYVCRKWRNALIPRFDKLRLVDVFRHEWWMDCCSYRSGYCKGMRIRTRKCEFLNRDVETLRLQEPPPFKDQSTTFRCMRSHGYCLRHDYAIHVSMSHRGATPMLGLFAKARFYKGDVVTEYGGILRSVSEMRESVPREKWTHARRIPGSDYVRDGYDMSLTFDRTFQDAISYPTSSEYVRSHGIGFMANTGSRREINVRIVSCPPRRDGMTPDWLFLVATRRINPGDEIISPYNNLDPSVVVV